MSSNYPEGSMRGSGIYAQEFESSEFCETCDKEVDLLFTTDDWNTTAWAECSECGHEFERDLGERDEDADYDAWRDAQLELDENDD